MNVSGPSSAPHLDSWRRSPFFPSLTSPASSLPVAMSPSSSSTPTPSFPLYHHYLSPLVLQSPSLNLSVTTASAVTLTNTYCSTPVTSSKKCSTLQQSSTLPFSISNILGQAEHTRVKEEKNFINNLNLQFPSSFLPQQGEQSLTLTDDSGYDSFKLSNSQSQVTDDNEDSYIDVVGIDDDDDTPTKDEKMPENPVNISLNDEEAIETKDSNANDNDKPENLKGNDHAESNLEEIKTSEFNHVESNELVFDIKRKMLDNWAKSKQNPVKPTEEHKTSDLKSISEYRHKKIRRSSLENQDGTGAVKKKTFVLDNYELNTNINKNKRKDEKLSHSHSESDSPDKKKQEKLKKKHKSHKEERWKISKTIKSPIRYPGQDNSSQEPSEKLPSCILTDSDLIEGLRLLLRVGSHFYAGRLSEISPPDIYGIIIDKERGSKPHIFPRKEIIRDAVSCFWVIHTNWLPVLYIRISLNFLE